MSFENKTFALTIFRLSSEMPEDTLEIFVSKAGKKLDELTAEENIGWVSGRHLLETAINENTAIFGGNYSVNLRIAQRKIPAPLLNAECKMIELEYKQQNNLDFVPAKIRREIKQDIEDRRVANMPPQITGIPVLIDRASNILYLGTASKKTADIFVDFFHQTFSIEPIHADLEDIMARVFKETPESLPVVSFSESALKDEFAPGRDFLTWLWYSHETSKATFQLGNHGQISFAVQGPLTFAFSDETKGAGETIVKKGNPQHSAEAKAALSVGKKLKKAKVQIAQGNNIWTATFDADRFAFSGMSLPEGEQMEIHSKYQEKAAFLDIFRLAVEELFKKYVVTVQGEKFKDELKRIHKWSAEKESF
ncbi:MAG: recombination-associated protein RdgC [Victivallales bacterium]|nr:recombination-associated protein RdgC [Victivallales bacterium]